MDRIKNIINGSTKKDKYKIRDRFRHLFQFVWFLITNSYFEGFKTGKIYGGNLKKICVPGMNCYSCPGAKGSCPIGSLQAVIGNSKYKISYYIVGILFFIGALVGRFVCGWLCPFGLIQDLLHKIPFFKKVETFKFDKHCLAELQGKTLRQRRWNISGNIATYFLIILKMLAITNYLTV